METLLPSVPTLPHPCRWQVPYFVGITLSASFYKFFFKCQSPVVNKLMWLKSKSGDQLYHHKDFFVSGRTLIACIGSEGSVFSVILNSQLNEVVFCYYLSEFALQLDIKYSNLRNDSVLLMENAHHMSQRKQRSYDKNRYPSLLYTSKLQDCTSRSFICQL